MAGIGYHGGNGWVPLADMIVAGDEGITALTVHQGRLIAGGSFSAINGVAMPWLAQHDGATWSPVPLPAQAFNGPIKALASYQGKLYVGGVFDEVPGSDAGAYIAVWDGAQWRNVGGSLRSTFPGRGSVLALYEYNGRLIVAGRFTHIRDYNPALCIAAWDGQQWEPLGSGLNGMVSALTTWNGQLVAAGAFAQTGASVPANHVASWNGASWSDLGAGLSPTGWASSVGVQGPPPTGYASGLATIGNDLYLVGTIPIAGQSGARSILRWNGAQWVLPSQGPPGWSGSTGAPRAVLQRKGTFLVAGAQIPLSDAAGAPAPVVEVRADSMKSLAGRPLSPFALPGLRQAVVHNGELFGVSGSSLYRWNGNRWLLEPVDASLVDALWSDSQLGLLATGRFATTPPSRNALARLDGTTWTPLVGVGQPPSAPSTLSVARLGSDLYIGGPFNTLNGVGGFQYAARFDGQSWHSLPLNNAPSVPASVINGFDGVLWYQGGGWVSTYRPGVGWDVPPHAGVYDSVVAHGWLYSGGAFGSIQRRRVGVLESVPDPLVVSYLTVANYRGDLFAGARQTFNQLSNTQVYDGTAWFPLGRGIDGDVYESVAFGDDLLVWHRGSFANDFYSPGVAHFGPAHRCDGLDFNNDGLYPDNADLADFLAVFGGGACSTGTCQDIDFNNDGLYPDNEDLLGYLRVFGGGVCVE